MYSHSPFHKPLLALGSFIGSSSENTGQHEIFLELPSNSGAFVSRVATEKPGEAEGHLLFSDGQVSTHADCRPREGQVQRFRTYRVYRAVRFTG